MNLSKTLLTSSLALSLTGILSCYQDIKKEQNFKQIRQDSSSSVKVNTEKKVEMPIPKFCYQTITLYPSGGQSAIKIDSANSLEFSTNYKRFKDNKGTIYQWSGELLSSRICK